MNNSGLVIIVYVYKVFCYTPLKTVLEDTDMPRYVVTLTDNNIQELKALVQKGGKVTASGMHRYF